MDIALEYTSTQTSGIFLNKGNITFMDFFLVEVKLERPNKPCTAIQNPPLGFSVAEVKTNLTLSWLI